jgi:hypothetical protein
MAKTPLIISPKMSLTQGLNPLIWQRGTVNGYMLYVNGIEDLLINMMTPVFFKIYSSGG